jgi:hypothetical protein
MVLAIPGLKHDHHVGMQFLLQRDRMLAIQRTADYVKILLRIQKRGKPIQNDLVVVRQQHSNNFRRVFHMVMSIPEMQSKVNGGLPYPEIGIDTFMICIMGGG